MQLLCLEVTSFSKPPNKIDNIREAKGPQALLNGSGQLLSRPQGQKTQRNFGSYRVPLQTARRGEEILSLLLPGFHEERTLRLLEVRSVRSGQPLSKIVLFSLKVPK